MADYSAPQVPLISANAGVDSNAQVSPNLAATLAQPQEAAAKALSGWADDLTSLKNINDNRDLLYYSAEARAKMQEYENSLNHLGDDGLPDNPDYYKPRDQVMEKAITGYLSGVQEQGVSAAVMNHLNSTLVPSYKEEGLKFMATQNAAVAHGKVLQTLSLNTQNMASDYQNAKASGLDPFPVLKQSIYSSIASENTLYQSYLKIGNLEGAQQIAQSMHQQVETAFGLAETTAGGGGWDFMTDLVRNVAPSIPQYGEGTASLNKRLMEYGISGLNEVVGSVGNRATDIKNGTFSPAQAALEDKRNANFSGVLGQKGSIDPALTINTSLADFDAAVKDGLSPADAKAKINDIAARAEALSRNSPFKSAQGSYQNVRALQADVQNWTAPDLFERSRDGINFYNQIQSRFNVDNPNFLNQDGSLNQKNWGFAVDNAYGTLRQMVAVKGKNGNYVYTPQDQSEIMARYTSKFIPEQIQRLEKFGDRSPLPISQMLTSIQSSLGDDATNGGVMMKAINRIEGDKNLYDPKGETQQLFNRVGLSALYKVAQYGQHIDQSELEATLANHRMRLAQFGPNAGKEVVPSDFAKELRADMNVGADGSNNISIPVSQNPSTYEDFSKAFLNNIIKYDTSNGPRLLNQLQLANARAVRTGTPDYTSKILQEDSLDALAKAKAAFKGGQVVGKSSIAGAFGNLFSPNFTSGIGAGSAGGSRVISSNYGAFPVSAKAFPYSNSEIDGGKPLPPGVLSPAIPATTAWLGQNGKDIAGIRADAATQNTLHYIGTKEGWMSPSVTHMNFQKEDITDIYGKDRPRMSAGNGISWFQGRGGVLGGNAVFTGMAGLFGQPFYCQETPGSWREAASLNKQGKLKIENDNDTSPAHVWNEVANAIDNDGLAHFEKVTADGREVFLMGSAKKQLMVEQDGKYVPYLFDRSMQEATNFNISGRADDLSTFDKMASMSIGYRLSRAKQLSQ